jgi:gamma-glutamyltranspeptidase
VKFYWVPTLTALSVSVVMVTWVELHSDYGKYQVQTLLNTVIWIAAFKHSIDIISLTNRYIFTQMLQY